jgi:hypothetical protein
MAKQRHTTQPRERAGDRSRVLGVPLDTAIANRDRLARQVGRDFARELVFPELVAAILEELPVGACVLEVGAATGAITREIIGHLSMVTAIDISDGMLQLLLSSDFAKAANLRVMQGVAEDLPLEVTFDAALVTFTPRRGHTLAALLPELAMRVARRIVLVFPDDRTMDWAYLARTASAQGFDARARMVHGSGEHRGALVTVDVEGWMPTPTQEDDWAVDAREVEVPYPAPRGTAARLVRYFMTVGDRAILVKTDPQGIQRLYGNLRTAAHRLGLGEVTVRIQNDGIQIIRLPRVT